MNPYGPTGDIFRTDANQSANSFSDPLNMSHLYPGWGVNPNYQTPAYDSPYRPAYQGPNPYASYNKPGFLGAISQLYSPLYKDPYWGNPVSNNQNAFNAVASRPIDLMAHVGQNFLVPAVAFGLSNHMLTGVGKSLGRGLMGGMVEGLGAGILSTPAKAIGGFAGSIALPLLGGLALSKAADATVFQPYIRSRQMSQTVQDSFAGITFNGFGGNAISGRGLSGSESAGIGNQIDRLGVRDMTFSSNQYSGIASMGMRAGLFDDVASSGDISKRVSSIAAQIKMIVSISKDPNIQSAIEELSKLRLGGASVAGGAASQAMGAYSAIGMQASAAGASVQRVMNTVGLQGQYMYQMNGLTPYLGQVSAATAFSGFASAQRQGLMTTAQFARLGGIEGATQSALAAQMSGMQTPFNRMILANQFMGSGKTSGVVETVQAFGQLASKDPFSTMGAMSLYGKQMMSQQAQQEGHRGLEERAAAYLRSIGRKPGPNGYSPSEIAAALSGMGVPEEQIQAYATLRSSQTDSNVLNQNLKAFKAQEEEQLRQVISQEGLYGGVIGSITKAARVGAANIINDVADVLARPFNSLVGSAEDGVASFTDKFMYSSTMDRDPGKSIDLIKIYRDNTKSGKKGDFLNTDKYKVLSRINSAAMSGGPGSGAAKKLLEVGFDSPEAKKLFAEFIKLQSGSDFRKMYASLDQSSALFDEARDLVKGNILNTGSSSGSDRDILSGITGINTTVFDNLKIIGQAERLFSSDDRLGLSLSDTLKDPKYKELAGVLNNVPESQRVAMLENIARSGIKSGYLKSSLVASSMGKGNDKDLLKKVGQFKGTSFNFNDSSSREEIGKIIPVVDSSSKAAAEAIDNSSSLVDWKSFVQASNNIDKAAHIMLDAANAQLMAAGRPPVATGAGSGEKQVGGGSWSSGWFRGFVPGGVNFGR